jgi:D-beta-D-heptose 7-phosphate kinase/D-beta-D-heptose 1-phosphate adenosyltransferase
VFTNGCFDILHPGHLSYLEKARVLGDVLIVGINSDRSVRELKGGLRPIFDQEERCELLSGLESVSFVTVFDESTPRELIKVILPDVLVKGGDWPLEQIVGREEVEASGGRVVALPFAEGYSSSAIIQRILTRYAAVSQAT